MKVDHPVYQHRHRDAQGVEIIGSQLDLPSAMREAVRTQGVLKFGSWRPFQFNPLATLVILDGQALLRSADDMVLKEVIPQAAYDGDPDRLVGLWIKYANMVREKDELDRTNGLNQRALFEAMHETRFTSGEILAGQTVGKDPLEMRMALQWQEELTHAVWNDDEPSYVVAQAKWMRDGTLVFLTPAGVSQRMDPPVDLDRMTQVWFEFVDAAMTQRSIDKTFAEARAAVARGDVVELGSADE